MGLARLMHVFFVVEALKGGTMEGSGHLLGQYLFFYTVVSFGDEMAISLNDTQSTVI